MTAALYSRIPIWQRRRAQGPPRSGLSALRAVAARSGSPPSRLPSRADGTPRVPRSQLRPVASDMREKGRRKKGRTWAEAARTVRWAWRPGEAAGAGQRPPGRAGSLLRGDGRSPGARAPLGARGRGGVGAGRACGAAGGGGAGRGEGARCRRGVPAAGPAPPAASVPRRVLTLVVCLFVCCCCF